LQSFIFELDVAKARVVDLRLGVGIYAGSIPLVFASLFSLQASCLEEAIAEGIRENAARLVGQCAELFSLLAFHSFEISLADLFSTSMGGTRGFVQFEAFTFICLEEPEDEQTEASRNQQDVDDSEPLDSLLPEVEVMGFDLMLVDEGSENKLLFFGLVLVLVDGPELLLALDGDVWLLDIGESLVLGELF